MRQVKTHTLRYIEFNHNVWVFSFQDYGDHYRVRMDGPCDFPITLPTNDPVVKGCEYNKFTFFSGAVWRVHVDVARVIYSTLVAQGFVKAEYSPHMENRDDDSTFDSYYKEEADANNAYFLGNYK